MPSILTRASRDALEGQPAVGLLDACDTASALAAHIFLIQLEAGRGDIHCHVLLHRLLEQQAGKPVLEHADPSLDDRLDRRGEERAGVVGAEIAEYDRKSRFLFCF